MPTISWTTSSLSVASTPSTLSDISKPKCSSSFWSICSRAFGPSAYQKLVTRRGAGRPFSFHAARAGFEQLRATRGSLLFVSAGMALIPHAFQAHVGAAKAGIDMMMKNLAIEWGPHGIRCNSIVPGPIEGTEGMKRLLDPKLAEQFMAHVPARRMGTVDDIGQAAVFLASPLASYITGCVLVCDGGQNLAGSAPFNTGAAQMLAAAEATSAKR